MTRLTPAELLAAVAGAVLGFGLFLPWWRCAGCRPAPPGAARAGWSRLARELVGVRGVVAVVAGVVALLATRWLVAGIGVALLVLELARPGRCGQRTARAWPGWRRWRPGPSRCATPSPARSAWSRRSRPRCGPRRPSLAGPLARLVDRLHTREPLPDALHKFADDLDDPSADMIIAALIINARLRGPGLRDLLGALARSVREELDMRRKVTAERQVHPAQRPDRGRRLGRPGAGPGRLQPQLRDSLRHA